MFAPPPLVLQSLFLELWYAVFERHKGDQNSDGLPLLPTSSHAISEEGKAENPLKL